MSCRTQRVPAQPSDPRAAEPLDRRAGSHGAAVSHGDPLHRSGLVLALVAFGCWIALGIAPAMTMGPSDAMARSTPPPTELDPGVPNSGPDHPSDPPGGGDEADPDEFEIYITVQNPRDRGGVAAARADRVPAWELVAWFVRFAVLDR